jgi:hypothetical protein
MSKPRKKKQSPQRLLALPDLERAELAVVNTLTMRERATNLRPCHQGGRRVWAKIGSRAGGSLRTSLS